MVISVGGVGRNAGEELFAVPLFHSHAVRAYTRSVEPARKESSAEWGRQHGGVSYPIMQREVGEGGAQNAPD